MSRVARFRRRTTATFLLTLAAISLAVVGCSREPGQPRPAPGGTTSQNAATTTGTTAQSVRDLDLCTLLTPEDFPVEAAPGDTPVKTSDPLTGCGWTISVDNAGSTFSAGVAMRPVPFSKFVPPQSPNGRFTEIAGRKAWVGNALSDTDVGCGAIFGAADGLLSIDLTDKTGRGIDPCQTVTELAEIVTSRTPSPTE